MNIYQNNTYRKDLYMSQEFKRGSSNDGRILIAKHVCSSVLQCFTVSSKFYSTFVTLLFSQFNGLYKSINVKIRKDLQSVFPSMVDSFPSCKGAQSAMRQC